MTLDLTLENQEEHRKSPISSWKALIEAESITDQELSEALNQIYSEHAPELAEILMNPYCSNSCRHCIYPTDYHNYNETLPLETWESVFQNLHDQIGLRTFIFGGRELNSQILDAIQYLKEKYKDSIVGVITDGPAIEKHLEGIIKTPMDWIDVSIDGLEEDHDVQRNYPGNFRITVEGIEKLKEIGSVKNMGILTALTTLNKESVVDMVHYLNQKGFSNFFISPVGFLEGYRPNPELMLSKEDFNSFVNTIRGERKNLQHSYVSVPIFLENYMKYLKEDNPEIHNKMNPRGRELILSEGDRDNEFHISYQPLSLGGTHVLIVNSDGNIIPPQVIAMGKIPPEFVCGNAQLVYSREKFYNQLNEKAISSFYLNQLKKERQLLR